MAVWRWRSGEPTTLDNTVLAAMVAVRTSGLDVAATTLTALGSFRVVAVVTAIIAGILVWPTRNLLLALTLVITIVETSSIVYENLARESRLGPGDMGGRCGLILAAGRWLQRSDAGPRGAVIATPVTDVQPCRIAPGRWRTREMGT